MPMPKREIIERQLMQNEEISDLVNRSIHYIAVAARKLEIDRYDLLVYIEFRLR